MAVIPVTLVGIGKIARDQHLPAIAANPDFRLAAAVSRNETVPGVPNFKTIDEFLVHGPEGAVSLCTPPAVRTDAALKVIAAGRDLMIEKPPAATLGEIETIIDAARAAGVSFFVTWHSRYAPAVPAAKAWMAGRRIDSLSINWREDVRRWHPNQTWIWQPGGFGVLDPGINALSILTEILPGPIHVRASRFEVPANAFTPIGVEMTLQARGSIPIDVVFDWRQQGPQTWDIVVRAEGHVMALHSGGATMTLDGSVVSSEPEAEYPTIYRMFADMVRGRTSNTDISPLRICADAYLTGSHIATDPFHD